MARGRKKSARVQGKPRGGKMLTGGTATCGGRGKPPCGGGRPTPKRGGGRPAPKRGGGRPALKRGGGRPALKRGGGRPTPKPSCGSVGDFCGGWNYGPDGWDPTIEPCCGNLICSKPPGVVPQGTCRQGVTLQSGGRVNPRKMATGGGSSTENKFTASPCQSDNECGNGQCCDVAVCGHPGCCAQACGDGGGKPKPLHPRNKPGGLQRQTSGKTRPVPRGKKTAQTGPVQPGTNSPCPIGQHRDALGRCRSIGS